MDKDALDVIGNAIHEWSGCHTDVHDELCSAYIDTGAPAVAAALGANGYVVVPRHLLDEWIAATGEYPTKAARQRAVAARAAVVEAVGPTREDTKL